MAEALLAGDFVMELRELGITPHDAPCGLHTEPEEIFGWLKTSGGLRQTRFPGLDRVRMAFTFALAAYNLIHMPKLSEASA